MMIQRNYIYQIILFVLINSPLTIKFDRDYNCVAIIAFFTLISIFKDKSIANSLYLKPIIIWGILMLYYYISSVVRGIPIENFNIVNVGLIEIAILTLIPYLFWQDGKHTLSTICISLVFFTFVAYHFSHIGDDGRLRSFLYINQIAQICGINCICNSLYIAIYDKRIVNYILFIPPSVVLFLCGSRNGLVLILVALIILLFKFLIKKNIGVVSLILCGIFIVYSHVSGMLIFQRMSDDEIDYHFVTNTILDNIFGDRAIYYMLGFQNFLEHPIIGIGLLSFMDYNKFDWILHSEPMTHLAEGGIIGFTLYVYFMFLLFHGLIRTFGKSKLNTILFVLSLFVIFIVGLTARIYMYPFFFIIYALVIGHISKENKV